MGAVLTFLAADPERAAEGEGVKKAGLFGASLLVGLLAACGTTPKAELTQTGHGAVPLFTDAKTLVKPLSEFSNVEFAKTAALPMLAAERGGGLVGYTPDPLNNPERPDISVIRFDCRLILCNKLIDNGYLTLGQNFVGAYLTPSLIQQAAKYQLSVKDLRQADVGTMTKLVAASGLKIGLVGKYLPGSPLERLCSRQPAPRICWVIKGLGDLVVDIPDPRDALDDLGLIITDYSGLVQSDIASKLVQVHGKGLEPAFSALQVGFHASVDSGAATNFLEHAYSYEGQVSLARTGVLPVTEKAFTETVGDEVRPHVEDALEYGVIHPGR